MLRLMLSLTIAFVVTEVYPMNALTHRDCPQDLCTPFGLFSKKIINFNLFFTATRNPIVFDTTVFSTRELVLDKATGDITLKKVGYWLLHFSTIVINQSNVEAPIDLFVSVSGSGDILGSGRPTILPALGHVKVTSSVIVKVCEEKTRVTLYLLNPLNRSLALDQATQQFINIPIMDAIYLGPLNCVCQGCE